MSADPGQGAPSREHQVLQRKVGRVGPGGPGDRGPGKWQTHRITVHQSPRAAAGVVCWVVVKYNQGGAGGDIAGHLPHCSNVYAAACCLCPQETDTL